MLLSCLAVAMSSFSRARFARVVLMALLAVVLVVAAFGTVGWAAQTMFFPGQLHDPETLQAIGAALTIALALAAFFFAAACSRLAHHEENRSTGLRLMALVIVLCGLGWISFILGASPTKEPILVSVCLAFAVLGLASIFFVTEPERLGRRVAATLPKSSVLTWLATPLLPGGARGLLFFIGGGVLVTLWMYLYPTLVDRTFSFRGGQVWIPPTLLGYGVVYLGLPSALSSFRSEFALTRILARVGILVFFVASILLPTFFGFLLDIDAWEDWEHPGNVFLAVDHLWRHPMVYGAHLFMIVLAVVLTLLANGPRFVKMVRETHAARRQRLRRAA
jgi:hypothetical protein